MPSVGSLLKLLVMTIYWTSVILSIKAADITQHQYFGLLFQLFVYSTDLELPSIRY